MPDEHRVKVIESEHGTARWVCSCGQSSGGRWFASADEANKRAQRHVLKMALHVEP